MKNCGSADSEDSGGVGEADVVCAGAVAGVLTRAVVMLVQSAV